MLTSSAKCAIIFPVSEESTMTKVHGARWSPHALAEIANKKHPFIPRKIIEKKDEKCVDFVPKVC